MTDRDLDVPELGLALRTAAAARRGPATRRPLPALRTRALATLCVAVLALAGVLTVTSGATPPTGPTADDGLPARIVGPGVLRCALAAVPDAVAPIEGVVRGVGIC
ncbi:hypothetical protein [Patulibacter sp.]|uniref:hypothetical protein n=1 Tax=Patulibacter sp. TaxID=1912859 RepID=UPI002728840C|nr:hypothetical protein [Patulibacter sp.]MDO9407522.1 hypothetical protein [Patulibacter sp.]